MKMKLLAILVLPRAKPVSSKLAKLTKIVKNDVFEEKNRRRLPNSKIRANFGPNG